MSETPTDDVTAPSEQTVSIAGDFDGEVEGNVPVQGYGTVDGHPWYFRARGAAWSFDIAEDATADPVEVGAPGVPGWSCQERYGEWPAAGWMSHAEAWQFIAAAVARWRAGTMQYVTASNPLPSRRSRQYEALCKVNRGAYHTARKKHKAFRRAIRHVNRPYVDKPLTNA